MRKALGLWTTIGISALSTPAWAMPQCPGGAHTCASAHGAALAALPLAAVAALMVLLFRLLKPQGFKAALLGLLGLGLVASAIGMAVLIVGVTSRCCP